MSESEFISTQSFYRVFLTDFLSSVGGLIVALMAGARIVLSGHHAFFMMRAMTNALYSQADSDLRERGSFVCPTVVTEDQAKEAITQQVRSQRDFSGNYFSYTF